MKKFSKKLIVTLSLLVACVAAIVGTTLALIYKSADVGNVKVESASIQVLNVCCEDVKTYKSVKTDKTYEQIQADEALKANYSGKVTDCIVDALKGEYLYQQVDNSTQDEGNYTFGHGFGSALLSTENNAITLDATCIAPGDKITFTIKATIIADIDVKYGVKVTPSLKSTDATQNDLAYWVTYTPNTDSSLTDLAATAGTDVEIECSLNINVNANFDNLTSTEFSISFVIVCVQA